MADLSSLHEKAKEAAKDETDNPKCELKPEVGTELNRTKSDYHHLDSADWCAKWEKKTTGWHLDEVNPMLQKHVDKMIAGREKIKIFVPLCGKDLSMNWLADKGHHIVGVEFSELAIKEFFDEHKLTYRSQDLPDNGDKLFTANEKNIQIYCCDLFKLSQYTDAKFEAVWDRGSLSAVNRTDQNNYADTITSLISPTCRHLLVVMEYDETKYPGPPSNIREEVVYELFEDRYTVEKIDCVDRLTELKQIFGLDKLEEVVYLMK